MIVNVRKQIGNAIGAHAAHKGISIERAIAKQEKRGGLTDKDREWMREGHKRQSRKLLASPETA